VKAAPTLVAWVSETTQVAEVPVHGPLQPAKTEGLVAVAVSVTRVSLAQRAVQVAPQSMPAGVDFTVPAPLPVRVTVIG